MNIVGRTQEIEELERLYNADNSEFVAVYGRRRVGKTYLIKEVFKDRFAFWHTGLSPYDRDKKFLLRDQLQTFFYSLQDYGLRGEPCPKSWLEAFRLLEKLLEQKDNGEKLVVFIDEMPWMDTARSRFIPAFEHFWNGWAAKRDNILLIVCGSATSWIEDNILNSKGGLYNRLHREIKLRPFTLAESEEYFRSKGIAMSRYDVAQTYMVLGGIPHYLSVSARRRISTAFSLKKRRCWKTNLTVFSDPCSRMRMTIRKLSDSFHGEEAVTPEKKFSNIRAFRMEVVLLKCSRDWRRAILSPHTILLENEKQNGTDFRTRFVSFGFNL